MSEKKHIITWNRHRTGLGRHHKQNLFVYGRHRGEMSDVNYASVVSEVSLREAGEGLPPVVNLFRRPLALADSLTVTDCCQVQPPRGGGVWCIG